jgi:hypothetical protein
LTQSEEELLRDELLRAAREVDATEGVADQYGSQRGISAVDQLFRIIKVRFLMVEIPILSVVALLEDIPEQGLSRGQVGTVVEGLDPGAYEVEFSDDSGQTYASLGLRCDQLIINAPPLPAQPSRGLSRPSCAAKKWRER